MVGVWQLAVTAGAIDRRFLPAPTAVLSAIGQMMNEHILIVDISSTLLRVVVGFAIGACLGVVAGLSTGIFKTTREALEPVIQLARPIPAVALVPLAITWFGVGEASKLFIISWAAFFPSWVSTHTAAASVPKEFLWTAALLGADRWRTIWGVIIPWSLKFVQTGARISMGLAFAATVVAEMSGANAGLGYRIEISHNGFRMDRMLADMLLLGLLGACLDWSYLRGVRSLIPWAFDTREGTPRKLDK
jgi:NitT/TauT family transport system permease protein